MAQERQDSQEQQENQQPPQEQQQQQSQQAEEQQAPVEIEVPDDDPEAMEEFIRTLSPEQLADFRKNYLKEGENPEPEQSDEGKGSPDPEDSLPPQGGEDGSEEVDGLPAEILEALEPKQREYIATLEKKVKIAGDAVDEGYQAGLEKLLNDPVVKQRIQVLSGKEKDEISETVDSLFQVNELAKLRIDFGYDPKGSMDRLKAFVNRAVEVAQKTERGIFAKEKLEFEMRNKVNSELQRIVEVDPRLKTSLPLDDQKHPLSGFRKWLAENAANVNMVALGGPETYQLYLHKTGQTSGLNAAQASKQNAKTLTAIEKAKRDAAGSVGRRSQHTTSSKQNQWGIDVQRFRTDEDYVRQVYEKFGHDAQMRKVLKSLATE